MDQNTWTKHSVHLEDAKPNFSGQQTSRGCVPWVVHSKTFDDSDEEELTLQQKCTRQRPIKQTRL
jgi:hypothetical protein